MEVSGLVRSRKEVIANDERSVEKDDKVVPRQEEILMECTPIYHDCRSNPCLIR